jgi:hypothetical protein
MADQREIDGWRQAYAKYSEADLLRISHEKISYCAEHIAAQQELHDRRNAADHAASEQTSQISDRQHRQILFWAKVGVAVMILGVVVGVVQCSFR